MKVTRGFIQLLVLTALLGAGSAYPQEQTELPIPPWFGRGLATALLDPAPGVASAALQIPYAIPALSKAKLDSQTQRDVVPVLLNLLDDVPSKAAEILVPSKAAEILVQIQLDDAQLHEAIVTAFFNQFSTKGRFAASLGEIRSNDPKQENAIVVRLLQRLQDATNDPEGSDRISAGLALGEIKPNDREQRNAIIAGLINLLDDATLDDERSNSRRRAVEMLNKTTPTDLKQRELVVAALHRLLENGYAHGAVDVAAAQSLNRISRDDPARDDNIIQILFNRFKSTSNSVDIRIIAERSLGYLRPEDQRLRDAIINSFIDVITKEVDVNMFVYAANGLANFNTNDLEQRNLIVATLLSRVARERDTSIFEAAADAMIKITLADPEHRTALVTTLIDRVGRETNEEVLIAATTTLGKVIPNDPENLSAVMGLLSRMLHDSTHSRSFPSFIKALGKIELRDSPVQRGIIVTSLIDKLRSNSDDDILTASLEALIELRPTVLKEREAVVAAVLKRLPEDHGNDFYYAAAQALKTIMPFDSQQRKTVVAVLLNLLERGGRKEWSPDDVVEALAAIQSDDPDQRAAVLQALMKRRFGYADRREDLSWGLLAYGPIGADQILFFLGEMHSDALDRTAWWRARAIAYAGPTAAPDAAWVFVRFLGRPNESEVPWSEINYKPASAISFLGHFNNHWPMLARYLELGREAADRAIEIVRRACPSGAERVSGRSWYEAVFDLIRDEASSTWRWIVAMLKDNTARHCWTNADRVILTSLEDHFESANLRLQAATIREHLKSDDTTPALGLLVSSYLAWSVPCLVLIAMFPHSARVRALYLYNDRARVVLSLGWIPVLLTTVPYLRTRLLQPFRNDLLADARLNDLDETTWYSKLTVTDRGGTVLPLIQAIPDIAGNVLLIGESGLGKSTYVRVLAKRSPRNIAFFNARHCDKGVMEAIVRRAKGVQGTDFFRSLIYTRDLAVIIDGLNEVSAEVRAMIVEFANDFPKADILMATQPIESIGSDRSPFIGATAYELRPLDRPDIENFLITRPIRNELDRPVTGSNYDQIVRGLVSAQLDNAPTPEEQETARIILSNPMDLTYASELIAMGQTPRPADMIGQAFRLACERYVTHTMRPFPELAFAQRVVEIRGENRNWLYADEFPNEQAVLQEYRLMVPRVTYSRDGKETVGLLFRHDKVMDFFMQIAFAKDEKLQLQHMDDPKYRGVYLLFAQTADVETARRLRDMIVHRAANTRDHTLSDEFVRRLGARYVVGSRKRTRR